MRARDSRDDPPTKRRPRQYHGPPVTLGHNRSHGVPQLLNARFEAEWTRTLGSSASALPMPEPIRRNHNK
jgi:hypothetical protein